MKNFYNLHVLLLKTQGCSDELMYNIVLCNILDIENGNAMNKKPNHRDQGKFEFPGCLGGCGSKLNFINFIQGGWGPDDGKITLAFKEMMNMNFILCKKI